MRVVWSKVALARAADIADRIAEDAPRVAELWLLNIFAAVERLQEFPDSGRVVPEARREEIREVIHRGYRIIYRRDAMDVSILTIRHSRQLTEPESLSP